MPIHIHRSEASCSPVRSIWQAAVQLFDEVFEGDTPPQLAASLVLMLLDAQSRTEPIEHLDDLGCPLLGQQIDLQIKMIAPVKREGHPVLLNKYERTDKHAFQRYDHA